MAKRKLKLFNDTIKPDKLLFILTLIGYFIFSAVMIYKRIPFFDEVNAWNISQNCSLTQLFQISRREGHFILWYLLLKPLSLNNIGFEYSMFILNWIFAFSAVLLLWKKAPFTPWIKTCITFSLPIQMFSVYARCYALGVLVMFAICALYPKRKTNPLLYSALIILLANTSIIAAIAAFMFGLLYCCELLTDLFSKKIALKDLLKPFIVFLPGSILILSQIVNFTIPYYSVDIGYLHYRFNFFLNIGEYLPKNILILLHGFMLLTGMMFFDKKTYLFVVLSTLFLIFIALKIYALDSWHYMFLFLFFVSGMWIYMQENELKTTYQKIYYDLFFFLGLLWIFFAPYPWWWNGLYRPTTEYLKTHITRFSGSKIFLYPPDASIIGIVPMLKDYDIKFYSSQGFPYNSCSAYLNQWNPERVDFEAIRQELLSEPEKINKSYLFVSTAEEWKRDLILFWEAHAKNTPALRLNPYRVTDDAFIYKIYLSESHQNP